MVALLLTILLGTSVLVIARLSPSVRHDTSEGLGQDLEPAFDAASGKASSDRTRPHLTVVVVLLVTWSVLAMATAYPVALVGVLLVLVIGIFIIYRVRHYSMENRDFVAKLFSDLQRFSVNVRDDFWVSFVQLRAWEQERRARMEQERAAALEQQAQERAKLEQMERERRARPYNDYLTIGEYEDIQRNLQREQQRHTEQMEQKRIQREMWKDFWEKQNRRNRY